MNFTFDTSFLPYMPSKEIHEYFSAKATTVDNKSAMIKKKFDLWCIDFLF
ncbi:DUF6398 domain-containing protein [Galbibacter sp.]